MAGPWYCAGDKYTAVTAWAAAATLGAGAIRRQLATPTIGNERCFRTAAGGVTGAVEPAWVLTAGAASPTDGTITDWTEITGSPTYNSPNSFAAPFANLVPLGQAKTASTWLSAGEDVYVGNHAANSHATFTYAFPGTAASPNRIISIDDTNATATPVRTATAAVTMDITTDKVTWTAHGRTNNSTVMFGSTGTLPTGLTAGTIYFIVSATANDFQVSATQGGAAINMTGANGSGHVAYAFGGIEQTTGVTVINGGVYFDGFVFINGVGAGANAHIVGGASGSKVTFNQGGFLAKNSSSAGTVNLGSTGSGAFSSEVSFIDSWLQPGANAAQSISFAGAKVRIRGGLIPMGQNPTNVFSSATKGIDAEVNGFDMSAVVATSNLVLGGAIQSPGIIKFRNCKPPTTSGGASWSGGVVSTAMTLPGLRIEAWNVDYGDTTEGANLWIEEYYGTIRYDTSVYKDNAVVGSLKMTSNANTSYPLGMLRSPEFAFPDSGGNVITAAVEAIHSGVGGGTGGRFLNSELYLETQYQGTSGFPLSLFDRSSPTSFLATAATNTASTAAWAASPATPVKEICGGDQITTQESGNVRGTVCLTKPSVTVYVNPAMN